jgi:hypothetical protein
MYASRATGTATPGTYRSGVIGPQAWPERCRRAPRPPGGHSQTPLPWKALLGAQLDLTKTPSVPIRRSNLVLLKRFLGMVREPTEISGHLGSHDRPSESAPPSRVEGRPHRLNGGNSTIDCMVRDLTDQGARLEVASTRKIPEFYLRLANETAQRPCRASSSAGGRV